VEFAVSGPHPAWCLRRTVASQACRSARSHRRSRQSRGSSGPCRPLTDSSVGITEPSIAPVVSRPGRLERRSPRRVARPVEPRPRRRAKSDGCRFRASVASILCPLCTVNQWSALASYGQRIGHQGRNRGRRSPRCWRPGDGAVRGGCRRRSPTRHSRRPARRSAPREGARPTTASSEPTRRPLLRGPRHLAEAWWTGAWPT
jgi:hypothetical protein